MSRLDLHLHTTHSDGSCTPTEVVGLAHRVGVTAMAITDHDITTGLVEAMTAGEACGIEVIPGVEISSSFGNSEVHILGYFLDWEDIDLNKRLKTLRDSRHRRNPKIVEQLQNLGIDLTYEEVRALAGSDSVGRPHIARALMDKGIVSSAKEAFDRFLADGKPAYVPRDLPAPVEAIHWIKAAGGLAVLAHPTWVRCADRSLAELVRQLKADGLDGVEVYYSTHAARQTREYLSLAQQLGLLVTGGSDFHGLTKPDIEVGIGKGSLHIPTSLLPKMKDLVARG
ncbi:MAG: PHP domain-containing protein [Nitrospira sp.]|nr:PHP domain-containing protein [Nitrospira sp.]MDH4369051.1 PHP domain-containing protein [Nitrospira sp.]MDH5348071.1 PHP domain-containing protein [Nitrospira sp.]MDH5496742.1 PHP domain-containing protein [Nitrospira sp.]MDH5726296.1 PHP domain-containing protein [Nitrospira sp.]